MKNILVFTFLVLTTTMFLSGCWDSDGDIKAREQEQHSKEFWDMGGPTDRSKSKSYRP